MPVRIGQRYKDRYEVVAHVGEGAFAHVFRARELSSGRDCALKVLKEEYSDNRDVIERFQREVFAIASISSPHVVSMLDFGIADTDREFFMVMEFVQGPTLRELLGRHEPWAPEDVLVVVGQVAHALMAAHKREIIHRDLKPENVMLVERSGSFVAKVLDFGFAKLAELERTLELRPITRVGFCFGTPQYLSPEQIRGRPIDGGADLFALGVIAYEMLAGRRPWDGRDPREVMTAVLKTLPPPILTLHPSLMSRLEEVNRFLLRVLEKDRAARPRDAVAFFDELQDALFGGAAAARNALAGARPVSPIEDVTSRSIVVRPVTSSKRFDETEIDPARGERPAAPSSSDTVRETAIESESIPIFVAERLDSQYLPPLDVEEVRDDESGKSTLPRGTAQIPKTAFAPPPGPRRSYARLVATVLIVMILLTAAFLAGRYLKF
ncbi:MAG TPA: serine/threonine-protein kinase [Polyangia bacterium]|nr:serine/threonine-protein kinase [Polyangia bacterium]